MNLDRTHILTNQFLNLWELEWWLCWRFRPLCFRYSRPSQEGWAACISSCYSTNRRWWGSAWPRSNVLGRKSNAKTKLQHNRQLAEDPEPWTVSCTSRSSIAHALVSGHNFTINSIKIRFHLAFEISCPKSVISLYYPKSTMKFMWCGVGWRSVKMANHGTRDHISQHSSIEEGHKTWTRNI